MTTDIPKYPAAIRFAAGILLVLLLSLIAFNFIMSPPAADFRLMALFLFITALISGVIGYTAYRFGWLVLPAKLRWSLLMIYAISSVLTFLNVFLTARLMFASQHDLLLSIILLFFAGGIAMVLGYFLSTTITDRVQALKGAADRLSKGDLEIRVPIKGRDEIADLAHSFNHMASQLQEIEDLRADLIAWISHDLQTPLASIQAILEALSDDMLPDVETEKRYLRTAQKNVRSLSDLIDDLFQIAQLDAGGITLDLLDNSLADLISDTLESFSERASRQKITLKGHIEEGVDPVMMDIKRIGRVLNNLVSNAFDYTPEGGSIEINAYRVNGKLIVGIQDSGEGIDAQDLPFVFDRFFRGEKSRNRRSGGAGLGLAISKGIINAHGGEIIAESQLGKGALFKITL